MEELESSPFSWSVNHCQGCLAIVTAPAHKCSVGFLLYFGQLLAGKMCEGEDTSDAEFVNPTTENVGTASGEGTLRIWEVTPWRERCVTRWLRPELVERLAPRVARLREELGDPRAVARALRADLDASAREREVAMQLLLAGER